MSTTPRDGRGIFRSAFRTGNSPEDGRREVLKHKLTPPKRLRRFDSADFFSDRSRSEMDRATQATDATTKNIDANLDPPVPPGSNTSTSYHTEPGQQVDIQKILKARLQGPRNLRRFDSADYFMNSPPDSNNSVKDSDSISAQREEAGFKEFLDQNDHSSDSCEIPTSSPAKINARQLKSEVRRIRRFDSADFATGISYQTEPAQILQQNQKKSLSPERKKLSIDSTSSPPFDTNTLKKMHSPRPNESRVARKLARSRFNSAEMFLARKERQAKLRMRSKMSKDTKKSPRSPARKKTPTRQRIIVPPPNRSAEKYDEANQHLQAQRALRNRVPRSPSDRPPKFSFTKEGPAVITRKADAASRTPTRSTTRELNLRKAALHVRLGATGKSLM